MIGVNNKGIGPTFVSVLIVAITMFAIRSLFSYAISNLPYSCCRDGISHMLDYEIRLARREVDSRHFVVAYSDIRVALLQYQGGRRIVISE